MSESTPTDVITLDASSIADGVTNGTLSARDVVADALDRIRRVNPSLRAVVGVDEEGAIAAAEAVDDRVRKGQAVGPLAGVPIVTKVNVDQRGSATTNGVAAYRDRTAMHDNPAILNLRDAGAIIVGRSTTPAFSWRWFTDSELYGTTVNPRNPGLTAGGSSGGSAAAVAAGLVPIGHGSDLAGSIRVPSMACGVFGLKPSHGRVPSFDSSAPADRPPFAQLLGVQGAIGRSVADLRRTLQAMSVYSELDPWAVPRREEPAVRGACRVAVVRAAPWADVDPEVSAAVDLAASRLAAAGYELVDASPPGLESTRDIYRAVLFEATLGLFEQIDRLGDDASRGVATALKQMAEGIDTAGYLARFAQRTALIRRWQVFIDEHPLVLMPVSWRRTFPVDFDQRGPDAVQQVLASMVPSIAVNLCGLPSVAAPTSLGAEPLGVQLVGARFQEERCLAAAEIAAVAPMVDAVDGPLPVSESSANG